MARVNLPGLFFNAVADPADRLAVLHAGDLSRAVEAPGRVVRGAGGRVRVVRRAGAAREWSLRLDFLSREQVRWLESHVGELLCVRDVRGNKVFGVYLGVQVDDVPMPDGLPADVSLTVTEITHSEAV